MHTPIPVVLGLLNPSAFDCSPYERSVFAYRSLQPESRIGFTPSYFTTLLYAELSLHSTCINHRRNHVQSLLY